MDAVFSYLFPGPVQVGKGYYTALDSRDGKDIESFTSPVVASRSKSFPYFLNPFILSNAGFVLGYFNVGTALYFLGTPVSYYLITTLDVSSTQYSAYNALISIPWSLKFVFGMISDGYPILQYRRKSWFLLGWTGFVMVNFYLASTGGPGINFTISLMFLMTCLYLLADVCTDTLAVERSRYEPDAIRGSLQTSCYTIRSFGSIIGALLGALLYNTSTWGWGLDISQCFFLSGLIPALTILPLFFPLEEFASTTVAPSFNEQVKNMWETLKLRAVYQPFSFIYIYGIFQVPNSAWSNFLLDGLGFTDFEYGMLVVVATVLTYIGMNVYKSYFFETSWRTIYIGTTILNAIFSLMQIFLILGINKKLGIPDFYFSLGDTAVAALVSAIQFMPSCIMAGMLCPAGSEGLVYAVLTTIMNLSGTVASDIGSTLTLIWDVSNSTLAAGDYSGILYLTILTSFLQVFPLCFVWMLPDSREEQLRMKNGGETNRNAGIALATVIFVSLIGTIFISIYLIWY